MQTSKEVRDKAIFLLFNWKNSFRHCEKIGQVYDLLRDQRIIEEDPSLDEDILRLPKPQPRMAVFEDEEKARLLDQLLKSKSPEDLQAANRLIKSMVRAVWLERTSSLIFLGGFKIGKRTSTIGNVRDRVDKCKSFARYAGAVC